MNPSIIRTSLLALLALGALAAGPASADGPAPLRWELPGAIRGDSLGVQRASRGEIASLRAIREDANRQLQALQRSIAAMPDGPARQAAMKRAETVKRDAWVRVLQAGAVFARERGDLPRARALESAANRVLHPPAPAADAPAKAWPEKPAPAERRVP